MWFLLFLEFVSGCQFSSVPAVPVPSVLQVCLARVFALQYMLAYHRIQWNCCCCPSLRDPLPHPRRGIQTMSYCLKGSSCFPNCRQTLRKTSLSELTRQKHTTSTSCIHCVMPLKHPTSMHAHATVVTPIGGANSRPTALD